MKNSWKGLVVGGLTGAAFGLVMDMLARAGEGAREGAEFVQEHAPDAIHWAKTVAERASEKIRDIEVPDKVHDLAHGIQAKAPDLMHGIQTGIQTKAPDLVHGIQAKAPGLVQGVAQKVKDAGIADKVQGAAEAVTKRAKDAGIGDKVQDLGQRVADSGVADRARQAVDAAEGAVKEAAGKK
ncbi:MAG TPA: hypothetical protein VKY26_11690 [Actinomycetota bacterium]|nr:hypothetical protein [Actinomycetota bacterium]